MQNALTTAAQSTPSGSNTINTTKTNKNKKYAYSEMVISLFENGSLKNARTSIATSVNTRSSQSSQVAAKSKSARISASTFKKFIIQGNSN